MRVPCPDGHERATGLRADPIGDLKIMFEIGPVAISLPDGSRPRLGDLQDFKQAVSVRRRTDQRAADLELIDGSGPGDELEQVSTC